VATLGRNKTILKIAKINLLVNFIIFAMQKQRSILNLQSRGNRVTVFKEFILTVGSSHRVAEKEKATPINFFKKNFL